MKPTALLLLLPVEEADEDEEDPESDITAVEAQFADGPQAAVIPATIAGSSCKLLRVVVALPNANASTNCGLQ